MKYIDIETAPLPEETLRRTMPEFTAPANWKDAEKIQAKIKEQESAYIEKAALSPMTGRVQAIGIYCDKEDAYTPLDETGCSEAELCDQFWKHIAPNGAIMTAVYGWNHRGFDIPFMVKRSWRNGVKVPSTVFETCKGRTYLNPQFIDLMRVWTLGTDERYAKLDTALEFLTQTRKVDLGGKLPYEIFKSDYKLFHEYLRHDVAGLALLVTAIRA